ncbi:MAG: enoyl-CoA hydratase [Hyphomicrobiales bacterium]|nr:enoyl-CoA hydratase [Hyphomicrobiales bacterium]
MSDLLETIADGVAVLTMNRPERRNALSPEMVAGLLEALPRLAADPGVGAVILTGAGPAFCAGGDVKAMAARTLDQTLEERTTALREKMEVSRWLHEMGKPTIAMVRGAAAGAGLSMALACDMRFAAEGTKMTTAFVNVGFSGDFGGSYFLTHLVGTAKARELYYSGDVILADEALRLGMVNRVYPEDRLEAETRAFAARLAAGPRIAIGYMKRNMNAAEQGTLAACFDGEALHHSRTGMTEDHREATRAFVEKRKPVFRSR